MTDEFKGFEPKRLPSTEAVRFIGRLHISTKVRTQGERGAIRRDEDGHNLREFAAAQWLWKTTCFGEACNRKLDEIMRRVREGTL